MCQQLQLIFFTNIAKRGILQFMKGKKHSSQIQRATADCSNLWKVAFNSFDNK
jgi:hypothetical protein